MKVKLLFEEHANNYFLTRTDVTKKTLELTKYVITSFIEFIDKDKESITDIDYLEWQKSMNIANNTKSNYQRILAKFINYINLHGYRFIIPTAIKTIDEYIPHYFNDEEYIELIELVDNYHYTNSRCQCEDYCLPMITRILISTGARLSEICSLSVKDYDKELGIIHVKKTKGKKERLIPLHQTLIPIFNKYVDNLINRNPCEEYLFPLKDHKNHMTKNHVENTFRIIFKKIGYKRPNETYKRDVCPHCFRHTFAINSFKQSLEQGFDLVDVVPYLSIYLGHSRLSETEKYLKFSSDLFQNKITQFENYMDDVFKEDIW